MATQQWRTTGFIVLFILAHFSHHVLTALVVPLLPFIRDSFSLNYAAAGMIPAAFTFFYGLGQLPAGWLADKAGPRLMLSVGVAGVAFAGALVGLSQGMILLVAGLILMGLAGGGYHPAAPPAISGAVGPKRRGRALGFHVIGGSSSHFLAPLIGVGLASYIGWRGAFLVSSIPVLIYGVVFYLILGGIDRRRARAELSSVREEGAESPMALSRLTAFLLLTSLTTAFVHGTITFVPLLLVDQFGAGEELAAAGLSFVYSVGFWSAPLGGYLSDRWGRIPVLAVVSLLLIPVLMLLPILPLGAVSLVLMLFLGMVLFVRMPVSEAFILESVSAARRSTVLGIYYAAGMIGGGLITPVLGFGIDRLGFSGAFLATGGIYTLILIPLLLPLLRPEKKAA